MTQADRSMRGARGLTDIYLLGALFVIYNLNNNSRVPFTTTEGNNIYPSGTELPVGPYSILVENPKALRSTHNLLMCAEETRLFPMSVVLRYWSVNCVIELPLKSKKRMGALSLQKCWKRGNTTLHSHMLDSGAGSRGRRGVRSCNFMWQGVKYMFRPSKFELFHKHASNYNTILIYLLSLSNSKHHILIHMSNLHVVDTYYVISHLHTNI